ATATTEIYTLSLHDALPICLSLTRPTLSHSLFTRRSTASSSLSLVPEQEVEGEQVEEVGDELEDAAVIGGRARLGVGLIDVGSVAGILVDAAVASRRRE